MDIESLFSKALGIEDPWKIVGVGFDSRNKRLEIRVDFVRGSTFECIDEETGESKQYKVYDTIEKTWRHLNFFEHKCYLIVRTPRIKPDSGGIKLVMPPWSGVVAGFTLLFEALILRMCTHICLFIRQARFQGCRIASCGMCLIVTYSRVLIKLTIVWLK